MSKNIQKKLNDGRQYRNMILEVKELDQEESYIVKGYATTFNESYRLFGTDEYEVQEMVSDKAFEECDMSDVIMQYDHQGRVFARISNNTLNLTTDEHGLLIEADLGGTEEGRKLYEEIKGGYTNKMSFGFTVADDEVLEKSEDEKRIYLRTITKIGKLFDVSAVSLPANDMTEISARAFCDGVIAEAEAERLLKAENERKRKALQLRLRLEK